MSFPSLPKASLIFSSPIRCYPENLIVWSRFSFNLKKISYAAVTRDICEASGESNFKRTAKKKLQNFVYSEHVLNIITN